MQRDPPLARVLPRQPGTKESRYKHLLAGDTEDTAAPDVGVARAPASASVPRHSAEDNRLTQLEEEVSDLRGEIADLKQQLASFRKQFE
jgi:uncharacterized protein YceH (UPF0502 family)